MAEVIIVLIILITMFVGFVRVQIKRQSQDPNNPQRGATPFSPQRPFGGYSAPAGPQPGYAPARPQQGRTDAANYEQRKYQAENMLRGAGYGNETTADMVEMVDSFSMNHLGIHDPNRCEEISPEDFKRKGEELRALLSGGIITKKEHDMILREYRACLRRAH